MTDQPTPQPAQGATAAPGRAALSKELGDFLIELSIGVHRYAMYPPGHPSLAPAVQRIVRRLAPLLEHRRHLNIGVARRQLIIEGVATDDRHPVLSDLARRLHDLQLGALSFEAGATGGEIIGLLGTLSQEPDPTVTPVGLLPAEEIPRWPHIRVFPMGYDRLAIREQDAAAVHHHRATQLWLGLAQAALAGQAAEMEQDTDPTVIARTIQEHQREAAYDQVIVGYLLQLAQELKSERGAEAERVRKRMAGLVRELDPDTLARLVELGGDPSAQKRFVLDANQSLAMDAVVKVMQAAASASGQTVSSSMTRLLSKLAVHADGGSDRLRVQAGAALRENVEKLMDGWELQDPNPGDYTLTLDAIARAAPAFEVQRLEAGLVEAGDELPGPLRLLHTALEVDAYGPTVQAAVLDLANMAYTGAVLTLLQETPPGNEAAREIIREITAPARVRKYLALPDVEDDALEALAGFMGEGAVPLFLDALAQSDSRAVRRKVFDRLVRMGPVVGEEVLRRLEGEDRWFVIRNALALLRLMPDAAAKVDPVPFLHHAEAQVRREALPLALTRPALRDRALALALADPDERNCRVALTQLEPPVPETLVPTLLRRVVQAPRDAALRGLGLRALRGVRSPLVRDAALATAARGRTLVGKVRLADPDPAVLEALRLLARDWPQDQEAQLVVEAAARSRTPEFRNAATGGGE